MSKGHDESGKHVEKHKDSGAGKEGGTGEIKKHSDAKKPDAAASHSPKGKKKHEPLPDCCHAWGCKAKSSQFNFCAEHFDHFKFGLIKKTGEPVSDYEKKIEHFMAYKAKRAAQRVA